MLTPYRVILRLFIGSLLAATVLYLPLLHEPQMRHEESRRALIAETMIEESSYMVPMFKGQVYAAKPPGYNWLIIAVSAPFGEINEFTIRLASLLCLLTLLAVMLTLLRRHLDGPALTFLAAGVILSPEMARKGTLGEIDMLFTLLVSVALWLWYCLDSRGRNSPRPIHPAEDLSAISQPLAQESAHENSPPHEFGIGKSSRALSSATRPATSKMLDILGNPWLLPGILIALAFLTKREPALVFYYGGLGALLLYQRRFMAFFQPPHLLAAGLTLGILGSWLWFMQAATSLDTLLASSMQEVVGRSLAGSLQTLLLHLVTWPLDIWLALFPFSLMLLLFLHGETRRAAFQQDGELLTFAFIMAAVGFVIHWLAPQSAVRYYLPLMPTLLVICAILYSHARTTAPGWLLYIARGISLLLVLLAALLLAYLQLDNLGLTDLPLPPAVMPEAMTFTLAVAALTASLLLCCWQFEKSADWLDRHLAPLALRSILGQIRNWTTMAAGTFHRNSRTHERGATGVIGPETGQFNNAQGIKSVMQDSADQRKQHRHLLTITTFCAVMVLLRIIHYAALLPDRLENFREHRPVKQFVADIYANVPQADLPIGSPAAMPHEIWWYMDYGDVTTRSRPYQLVFEDELAEGRLATGDAAATESSPITRMTWRGQGIALVKSDGQK